jgi:hypothetical protein
MVATAFLTAIHHEAMEDTKIGWRRTVHRAVDLTARLRRAREAVRVEKQEPWVQSTSALVSLSSRPLAAAAGGGRQINGALSLSPSFCLRELRAFMVISSGWMAA